MKLTTLLLCLLSITQAHAKLYQCTDQYGKSTYSDRPCQNDSKRPVEAQPKKTTTTTTENNQFKYDINSDIDFINKYFDQYDPEAIKPYSQSHDPDVYNQYFSRIEEINALRAKAVKMVLESGLCDKAVLSELNSKSTQNDLQFFVICENQQRFFFTEQQVRKNKHVKTQEQLAWKERDAISACRQHIETQVSDKPGKLDLHSFTGIQTQKHSKNNIVKVQYDFDFTNLFGVEAQYAAICLFRPGQPGEYELVVRH